MKVLCKQSWTYMFMNFWQNQIVFLPILPST